MHPVHVLPDDLECEVLLVSKVMVEGPLGSTCGREQSLDSQIVEALLQQHGHTRVEQALLGRMVRLRRLGFHEELAAHLLDHVVDDPAVLVLGAEHDDLCVGVDPDVVPGGQ